MKEITFLKSPLVTLVLGVALLLGSPLIAMTPQFTLPDGCPPCIDFPEVTYPFIPVGVGLGVMGLILAILGYVRLQRVAHKPLKIFGPLTCIALLLVLAGLFAIGFDVRGSGWVIALYSALGVYLLALGIGIGLYAIFSIWANWKSAIMLSVGTVLAVFSLVSLNAAYSDFLPRCFAEVGCNPLLARSTVVGVVMFGLLLAIATFLMGYGIASFKKR
mgnify:CR=1 FL=1